MISNPAVAMDPEHRPVGAMTDVMLLLHDPEEWVNIGVGAGASSRPLGRPHIVSPERSMTSR